MSTERVRLHPLIFVNIKPLAGDLETANDTIVMPAYSSLNAIEFTSLQNWTMTTNVTWITLNLTSGTAGYYSFSEGSTFTTTINNGSERYAYIYINNGNDTDTVVVKQEASPLVVNPTNLNYSETGGTQSISVNFFSWSTWNATTTDSWISISPASGTGNGTIMVTCSANPSSNPRNGKIIITGGIFTDTVFINQNGTITPYVDELTHNESFIFFSDVANEYITLQLPENFLSSEITITNLKGQTMYRESKNTILITIPISQYPSGFYIISVKGCNRKVESKLFIKQ